MNRFLVNAGSEEAFEATWRQRTSYLDDVPGFRSFHLLRGDTSEGLTSFISHSTWVSREAFERWTGSEAFRLAHKGERLSRGVVAAPPVFEGFDAVDLDGTQPRITHAAGERGGREMEGTAP